MAAARFIFGTFVLDCDQRTLFDGQRAVPLNARYFDALALLAANPGELITKDRFNRDVWRSVPVTDEALTQCIRTLRSALGDKARDPRFIETVPKHGYRFVTDVVREEAPANGEAAPIVHAPSASRDRIPSQVLARACCGGGVAGLLGGATYGLVGLPDAPSALSSLLVLLLLCGGIGVLAGAGVGAGLTLADRFAPGSRPAGVLGAALGGAVVGALTKLVGTDAFVLLFGRAPMQMTGAPEGLVLGLAVGLAMFSSARGDRAHTLPQGVAIGGMLGIAGGTVIAFSGGRLMAGSLAALAAAFGDSRISLNRLAALFGEQSFGSPSLAFTTAFEGMLFVAMVVGAIRHVPAQNGGSSAAGDAAQTAP